MLMFQDLPKIGKRLSWRNTGERTPLQTFARSMSACVSRIAIVECNLKLDSPPLVP